MTTSWTTIPHVTQHDHADISQLESMRKRFNKQPDAENRKLAMTAIVIKMVASVLKKFPEMFMDLRILTSLLETSPTLKWLRLPYSSIDSLREKN